MQHPGQIRQTLTLYAKDRLTTEKWRLMQSGGRMDNLLSRLTEDVYEASLAAQHRTASDPNTEDFNPIIRVGQIEAAVRIAEEVAMAQAFEEIDSLTTASSPVN